MDTHHVYRVLKEDGKSLPDAFLLAEEIEVGVIGLVGWVYLEEVSDARDIC